MSIEFDIACLRAPCSPDDVMGVTQLIARAKMAADQIEELIKQRDEALAALEAYHEQSVREYHGSGGPTAWERHRIVESTDPRCEVCAVIARLKS